MCKWKCSWLLSVGQKRQFTHPAFVWNIITIAQNDQSNKNLILSIVSGGTVNHYQKILFFQGASSERSEGGPTLKRLWTSSASGAGKGLFGPRMHPAPNKNTFYVHQLIMIYTVICIITRWIIYFASFFPILID